MRGADGTIDGLLPAKDRPGARTPMRCPVCDGQLQRVLVRDMIGVSADLVWQMHAGECPEHGWFQAEVISKPPRDVFAVDRPFGVARRLVIDGEEIYSFSTVWNDASVETKRSKVDPFDPRFWQVRRTAYRIL